MDWEKRQFVTKTGLSARIQTQDLSAAKESYPPSWTLLFQNKVR
jgi:hypothetical protein